jgi:hypothetical protein
MGGKVAVIGGLGGGFETGIQLLGLVIGGKSMSGIYVGSRKMQEDLSRLVSQRNIKPVVDRVFDVHQAREAYQHLASGNHFGKAPSQAHFETASYTSAKRSTVSGNFSTSRISNAACAFGFERPCSQFSSVRGLVRR